MPDKVSPGPICGNPAPREAVCIHTRKVYDSCRDKDCLQDIRVYLTTTSQALLEGATSVKATGAELLWANIDVEPITFNKGFYTVDIRFYYRITADVYTGSGRPRRIYGLSTFDKRTVLFGSEGSAHIFSSQYVPGGIDNQGIERSNLPIAVVEVVDPVVLGSKVLDVCESGEISISDIPEGICNCFDEEFYLSDEGRKFFVTLGQFSIIKLEREIQLLMPAYDICMPSKESVGSSDDPCELFQNFKFPVSEFFPPKATDFSRPSSGSGSGGGSCCSR